MAWELAWLTPGFKGDTSLANSQTIEATKKVTFWEFWLSQWFADGHLPPAFGGPSEVDETQTGSTQLPRHGKNGDYGGYFGNVVCGKFSQHSTRNMAWAWENGGVGKPGPRNLVEFGDCRASVGKPAPAKLFFCRYQWSIQK